MDLNGDGFIDLLSGSYSRHDSAMAGLFQVLWGSKDRSFQEAEPLKGDDGKVLLITAPPGEDHVTDRICTRPTAVDLNGDGHLDLVAGNFSGTFAWFVGSGKGQFAAKSTWLSDGKDPLQVGAHGDPFFVDWDRDGDLDLLSGSAEGGVFLFENRGTAKEPRFAKATTLVTPPAETEEGSQPVFGDAHIKGPGPNTRVWVDDLNGDGKPDLLVGDGVSLAYPADGLDETEARKRLAAWGEKFSELTSKSADAVEGTPKERATAQLQKAIHEHYESREKIIRDDATGYVWVLYQK